MKVVVDYIVDDENWTDEQYENQKEKTVVIDECDLIEILVYGRFNKVIELTKDQTIDIMGLRTSV